MTEFGINLKELLYADDLALFCDNRAQALHVLQMVQGWCERWGMKLNTGHKKTEVLVFGQRGWHPALAIGELTVPVADEYRYLGLEVNTRLEYEPLIDRYADKLWGNFNRFFRFNAEMRRMSLRAQSVQLRTFAVSATTFLASALPAHTVSMTAAIDKRLLEVLHNVMGLPTDKPVTGALLQEARVMSTANTWVRERARLYLEAFSTDTHNPRILLHRILMRQTAPAYQHADTWVAQTELMFRQQGYTSRLRACEHCWRVHPGCYVAAVAGSPAISAREAKRVASALGREAATRLWAEQSKRRLGRWDAARWLDRPDRTPAAFRHWLNGGYCMDNARERAGPYKCTPLSFTAPGGAGCILGNTNLPKTITDLVTQARQGSSSHCIDTAEGLRHPTSCDACGAPFGDPYHFLIECPHAASRTAQVAVRNGVVSIIRGILDRVKDLCRKLPEPLAAPMAGLLEHLQATIDSMPPGSAAWHTAAGKSMLARIAFAQPWAAQDLPPAVWGAEDDADAFLAGSLADGLGTLFDRINWPPYLTRALCNQWAAKASRIHSACNTARDMTHPQHPAWRRGGFTRRVAAAASADEARDEAAAAAFHAAAEAHLAQHGALPPPKPARRQRAPRGWRPRGATAAPADAPVELRVQPQREHRRPARFRDGWRPATASGGSQ